MNASLSELITQVRRQLDELTLAGQPVATDSDVMDTASSNFSDEDIKDRLIDGTRFVAARVRASSIRPFIGSLSPGDLSVPMGTDAPHVLRLLASRVDADGTPATRRTFAGHRKMESSGRAASSSHPVFVFEDFELLISAGGSASNKTADYVRVPGRNVATDGTSANPHDDITNAPSRFRNAIVAYAASSCFAAIFKYDLAMSARKRVYQEISNYRVPMQDLRAERDG